MGGSGGGLSPPGASQAPGYAQAIGHGLAVRVDEYGLEQGDGQEPLILGIHVIPGIAGQFVQAVAAAQFAEFTGVRLWQRGR